MASALSNALTKRSKNPTTYKALVVLGLQDDILAATSSASSNESSDFVSRILQLIPKFRNRAGNIIWVQLDASKKITDVPRNKQDVAAFFGNLSSVQIVRSNPKDPKDLMKNFSKEAAEIFDSKVDILMESRDTARSSSNSLLATLREEIITELFLCGCITDASGYSMMYDAARQGCRLNIIEDCLGYRDKPSHDILLKYAREEMCAENITSTYIDADLNEPLEQKTTPSELQNTLAKFKLREQTTTINANQQESAQLIPAKKSKKAKSKTIVQTREQKRMKDAKEKQRVRNALLEISDVSDSPRNDPIAESSRTSDAAPAQPQSSSTKEDDLTFHKPTKITQNPDTSIPKPKSSTKADPNTSSIITQDEHASR
jgi:nicotinamidase-related amidase